MADSGVDTGNDSNDSTMQEKLFKIDLESPKHPGLPECEKDTPQRIEKSQEPHSSSEIILMDRPHLRMDITPTEMPPYKLKYRRSFAHLQPPTLMHGYEYRPNLPASEACLALRYWSNKDIGGVFVSGGPLGTQYEGNSLANKLRRTARMRAPGMARLANYCKVRDAVKICRAACQNNTDAVRQMLESGVNPNVHDCYNSTPLHFAACMGYADMVKLLLDHGADPNAKDSIGNTPLHLAACTNHVPVITLLLKAGTRISAGNSPLQLAITKFNIIKRSVMPHPVLKEQVAQVISMLTEYMRRKEAPSLDAELLNKFESLVRVSDSSEQVESNIRDLVNNLSSLDISTSS